MAWRDLGGHDRRFAAEATEVADQTPTLVAPVIKAEKAQSWIEFSIEAGMDQPALAAELQKLLADQKDVLEATMFVTGNGTNQPEGISTNLAAGSVVTTASTASFAVADLYACQNALGARFSPRARWLSSLTVAQPVMAVRGRRQHQRGAGVERRQNLAVGQAVV